ncbi:SusC/RagA family TonB-linked outer membrane protein [Aurantibacter crassamenti]|uniref:SusC/RagA family TonB-linked outer membrane protein n=1 Tax=Aurantibacter crassamenti TaxID=1837375 RepID=UPI00193A94F5|nr:SusC/RagA family TonB-linked outer membrane protein [Aurantibacter crassamenti]MBM1105634.1 SusC/RagA family TonB-linked outer membrane protein [Aurantibacter crassamenti]
MKNLLTNLGGTPPLFQYDLKMKISTLFIFIAMFNMQANSYSQLTKITLEMENVSVERFLDEIEHTTEFRFVYKTKDVDLGRSITVKAEKETINDILRRVFKNTKTVFSVVGGDKLIHLTKNTQQASKTPKLQKELDEVVVEHAVEGTVTDENGLPLIGASIVEKATTNGVTTDFDGNFSISVSDTDAILVISYVGFATKELQLNGQSNVQITLLEDSAKLDEVVVTALGISRDEKSVGYSVTQVGELEKTGAYNVANALSGKVAGVNISQSASGVGGSSKVIIRGNNSLVGNGQPLYVVDGIPLNNDVRDEAIKWGGTDYGDGISSINQDDIKSISVLKGPNAASLYGQRGSNGVILITTKSGKARRGIGVSINSAFSVGDAAILPDFQNTYGQGLNGDFTHLRADDGTIYSMTDAIAGGFTGIPKASAGRNRLTRGSWGAPFNNELYEDQFGNVLPYVAQPNTFQEYFETQITQNNTVSLTGGNEDVTYFSSFSNFKVDGYVPTNEIKRNTFNLRVNAQVTPKLKLDAKINYSIQTGVNRPQLSDAAANPAYLLVSQPRSIAAESLADYTWTAEQLTGALGVGSRAIPGNEKTYATNGSTANQYWTINNTRNSDKRDRILASLNLNYDFAKNISLNLRGGTDSYTFQRHEYRAIGTRITSDQRGDIVEVVDRVNDNNFEALATFKLNPISDFNIEFSAGTSLQSKFFRRVGSTGQRFKVPDLYIIQNTEQVTPIYDLVESEIQSVYGLAQMSYKNYLYVDITGRNDWSSTLAKDNNSFFYPSVSASVVVSDALNISSPFLTFLKLRGSVAQAGNSGDPYQLTGAYSVASNSFVGRPTATFSQTIVDPNLKNELTTSYEFGADLNLFQNRLGFNFTYYSASTENQIVSVPVSETTNYNNYRFNSGEITNKGLEALVTATPIELESGFSWETSFSFAKNKNQVVTLADGVESFLLGDDRGVSVLAIPGEAFGELYGTSFAWLKDDAGNILIDPLSGLPLKTDDKSPHRIGNALPDWTGGFSNTFRYKNLSLSALVDIRQGGQIYSQSLREEIIYGTTNKTVEGRDGTYVADGVIAEKNVAGEWVSTGVRNAQQVNAQDYWNVVASTKEDVISEEMLQDASYISMREMTIAYQLPQKILSKTPFENIGISIYGRNLFYFERHTDGFAPEASAFNVNNSSVGLESTALPLLRTFGINLNLGF